MRNPCKEIVLAQSYGASPNKIRQALMSAGVINTYDTLKNAVREGKSIMQILKLMPINQPRYITLDLYKRAREEVWEEQHPKKTKMGRYIYV